MYKSRVFRDLGGYTTAPIGRAHLDYNLLSKAKAYGKKVVLVPAAGYDYRANSPGSVFLTSWSTGLNRLHSLQPWLDATDGWEKKAAIQYAYGRTDLEAAGNNWLSES